MTKTLIRTMIVKQLIELIELYANPLMPEHETDVHPGSRKRGRGDQADYQGLD